jgi:uncharacterized protein YcbX
MHVSSLYIHPVKSLRAVSVASVELDSLGVVGDRRFMVIDENGRFVTQRTLAQMALVETRLTPDALILSTPGNGQIHVPRASDAHAPVRSVSIWKSEGLQADDCGDAVAAWLGDFLGVTCRLVRAGKAFHRPMTKPAARAGDLIGFADAEPLLVISEASLADLNDRLVARGEEPLPMDRFRPNLVIAGCDPFAEDTWPRIRIGDVVLRAGGPCARCIVTTTNQQTAERSKEPLRTLATYRRDAGDPTDVNFGQNFIHETKLGSLAVGEPVEVLPV